MAYIKKNVNIFLLMLIILILGTLAGLTTYYQTTYKNLSMSYSEKLNQLNSLNHNLSIQKAQLSTLNDELKVKTEVKEKFDVLYTNISEFNDKISGDLSTTRTELIDTLGKLKKTEVERDNTKLDLQTTQAALKSQQKYNLDLNIEISTLKNQISSLNNKVDCYKTNANDTIKAACG